MGTTLRLYQFNTAEFGWRRANRVSAEHAWRRSNRFIQTASDRADERDANWQMERYAGVLRKLGATRTRDGWML